LRRHRASAHVLGGGGCDLAQVVGGSSVGFGALGLLFPRALGKIFGVSLESGEFDYVMRLAGAGNLGVGTNLVLAGEDERQRLLAIAAAVDGLSALFAIGAGVSGSLSKRTSVLLTLTTAGTAALSILSIRQRRKAIDE
jgi:hypothetical protein